MIQSMKLDLLSKWFLLQAVLETVTSAVSPSLGPAQSYSEWNTDKDKLCVGATEDKFDKISCSIFRREGVILGPTQYRT